MHEHPGIPNGKKCLDIDRSCRLQSFLPHVLRINGETGQHPRNMHLPLLFLFLFFVCFLGLPGKDSFFAPPFTQYFYTFT